MSAILHNENLWAPDSFFAHIRPSWIPDNEKKHIECNLVSSQITGGQEFFRGGVTFLWWSSSQKRALKNIIVSVLRKAQIPLRLCALLSRPYAEMRSAPANEGTDVHNPFLRQTDTRANFRNILLLSRRGYTWRYNCCSIYTSPKLSSS